ncbi:double zinc ribbon domain-containing protein [Oscillospiraceae bacterium PP1C4]
MTKQTWERILTLIFPYKCFCCGTVLAGTEYLCASCEKCLPETTGELCPRCGKKTADCMCAQLEGGYLRATAPLYYLGGVPHGIHRFKYDGRRYYTGFLAALMAKQVEEEYDGIEFDLITYVPMHPKKQRQRGFCQTQLLADKLAERLCLPVTGEILIHTGKGRAQMEQHGIEARVDNARISYTTRKAASLDGETVLLVDDVITTCSTAHRCAELLMKKGAGAVYVIAAATT